MNTPPPKKSPRPSPEPSPSLLTPMRLTVGWLCIVAAVVLAMPLWGGDRDPQFLTVDLADESFRMELAVTRQQQRKGMAGREEIAPDEGMLFVFDEPRVLNFWMKGCLIPLEIIYVDASGRIVRMHHMPAPDPDASDADLKRYSSYYPAQFAIEVKVGTIDRLELEEGQRLDLPLKRLKRIASGVDETQEDERENESTAAPASRFHGSITADQPRGRAG